MGDRDSEIAIVIEDTDLIESTMNGEKYMAARFAATFRRQLFKQHLGLVPPQDCPGPVTSAMHSVGRVNEYEFGTEEDRVVAVGSIKRRTSLSVSCADSLVLSFISRTRSMMSSTKHGMRLLASMLKCTRSCSTAHRLRASRHGTITRNGYQLARKLVTFTIKRI